MKTKAILVSNISIFVCCPQPQNLMQQEDLSKLGFDEKQQESGKAKDEKTRQVLSFNTDILV